MHTKKTVDTFLLRTAHTKKNCRHIFFKCVDNFFLNLITKNWKVLTKNWKVLTKIILFPATARHNVLFNTYKHHHTEILLYMCQYLDLGLFMSYRCDLFFFFIFIFSMINRIISWIQTHFFFCLLFRICPITFEW